MRSTGELGAAGAVLRRSGLLFVRRGPAMAAIVLAALVINRSLVLVATWFAAYRPADAWIGPLLALLVLGLAVLGDVLAIIAALWIARSGLPSVQSLSRLRERADDSRRPAGFLDMAAVTAIPVIALYSAWNLTDQYVETLRLTSIRFGVSDPSADGRFVGAYAVAAVLVFGLSRVVARLARRPGSHSALRLTVLALEGCYVFVAIFGLSQLADQVRAWIAGRAVSAWVRDLAGSIADVLPDLIGDQLRAFVQRGWHYLWQGISYPLVLLGIGCLVYGFVLHRNRSLYDDLERLGVIRSRFERIPADLRALTASLSGGITDKWGPVLDATRLLLRTRVIVLFAFAAAVVVWRWACWWAAWGATWLVSPRPVESYRLVTDVVATAANTVMEVGGFCLVAATYDALVGHAGRRTAELQRTPGVRPVDQA